MKIYIITDIEGISGMCVFQQSREPGPENERARHLLMGDVNAAVQGCLDGSADEVVVLDGHGSGFNFIMEEMHPDGFFVTGLQRPQVFCGLDETFDAVLLVGYHAMMGTETGMLHHTQSSKDENRYWYNDRETGEIGQMAIMVGQYDLPIVLVTGDRAACDEAKSFLGEEVVTVSVKEGYGRQCGKLIAPQKARQLIRDGAKEAMTRIQKVRPSKPTLPIEGRLQFKSKDIADQFTPRRAKRVDERTFSATFEEALDILWF